MGVSYGKIVWPLVGVVLLLSTATLHSRNLRQNAIIVYTNQALLFALYYAEYFLLSVPVLFWLAWRLMGRSWCGYTLCKAAAGNKLDEVRGLLRAGLADICYTDVHGGTALHYASANGHAAVARSLVEAGGQRLLLMCLKNGFNCLHLAAENGHLEVAKEIFKICAPAKWKELLMQPANNGMSCLSPAVHKEHLEVVKLLVQKGGKELVQMQEKDGTSCLQVSVCKKRVDILQVLLNSRADPDLENEHGRTGILTITQAGNKISLPHCPPPLHEKYDVSSDSKRAQQRSTMRHSTDKRTRQPLCSAPVQIHTSRMSWAGRRST
jgi:hypothetical protein